MASVFAIGAGAAVAAFLVRLSPTIHQFRSQNILANPFSSFRAEPDSSPGAAPVAA